MQVASLILGILSLAFLFLPGANLILSPMLGVAALVMGLLGWRSARRKGEDAVMGTAGLASGAIGLVLSLVLIGGCYKLVREGGREWRRSRTISEQVEKKFEGLSEDLRHDMREEMKHEIEQEMERVRQERIRNWKNREPWTDEEWKQSFDKWMDRWVEWVEMMPVIPPGEEGEAIQTEPPPAPPPPEASGPPPAEAVKAPPPSKKPAKKLPDVKYPFVAE